MNIQDASQSSKGSAEDQIPQDPHSVPEFDLSPTSAASILHSRSPRSSHESLEAWSEDSRHPSTPNTEPQVDEIVDKITNLPTASVNFTGQRERRASTSLISQDGDELRRILGSEESGTRLIQKYCCGGGCCLSTQLEALSFDDETVLPLPDNDAFRSLQLKLGHLSLDTPLTDVSALPVSTLSFTPLASTEAHVSAVFDHPPTFVRPHPPYSVFLAPVINARELTKPGAEKRTYHFDLDVTDYPDEGGVDFKVGGAIGICPPNNTDLVDAIFNALGVPRFVRDKAVILRTTGGRWPTIWGEEESRELITTRRELLTWCCDVESTPPTKPLLRLLAEYAEDACERKILMFLTSAEGQGAFCDLRTGPHITLLQILHAFPSSRVPLSELMSVLKQLMPRFYSLSNDPHVSSSREGLENRRLIEMAVSIHETPDWQKGIRTGVGSGYMERVARHFMDTKHQDSTFHIKVPMFRGLMANPLSREFVSDGPMMLIGAGVGMAPFRGFILNRLKNANCANKVWLLQGVRDSQVDELYRGELGTHESDIKRVVQSRKTNRLMGESKYVQEEVIHQADIVWFVINSVDGRVFVCGSSKGMGEGVHDALVHVSIEKGGLNRKEAELFWQGKKDGGQYITVSCECRL
jgi:sulfite reductase alpha subunit-like flavoprotein